MERAHIADYVQLLANPRKLIWRNMVGGIARGVGIAIGLTIFTSVIVYLLKALGALNLPIVGDFIADLVEHVQYQLEAKRY
ncbi:MAG: signal transduction histidine kinase [Paenibacillaceae bacterium]|nr:signal transduction histidine kinase [Paenibacillaceae bacterium]